MGAATQKCVSLSSGEAEWYALVRACGTGVGATGLFHDISVKLQAPLVLSDATAGLGLASRRCLGKTKHIQLSTLGAAGSQGQDV